MAKKETKRAPAKQYDKTEAGRAERFKDFANKRVNRALSAIGAVGKLASPRSYKYTPAQVEKIRTAMQSELDTAIKQFSADNATAAGFNISE